MPYIIIITLLATPNTHTQILGAPRLHRHTHSQARIAYTQTLNLRTVGRICLVESVVLQAVWVCLRIAAQFHLIFGIQEKIYSIVC